MVASEWTVSDYRPKKGDRLTHAGRSYIVAAIGDNTSLTALQELKAKIRFIRLMQWAGIPPVVPEHVELAKRLRPPSLSASFGYPSSFTA